MITFRRGAQSKARELADQRTRVICDTHDLIRAALAGVVPDLPGQDRVYAEKEAEALAFLALAEDPADLSGFRMIRVDVEAFGLSPRAAAEAITARAQGDRDAIYEIETLRRWSAAEIGLAASVDEMTEICTDLKFALRAL